MHMAKQKTLKEGEVDKFLADLEHPMKKEIEELRKNILSSNKELAENIKWNGPNFCFRGEDRITMRIHPPKQLQLIFHRGAKVQQLPQEKLIADDSGLLAWKTNDRAVATFKNMDDIKARKSDLASVIGKWLKAASNNK